MDTFSKQCIEIYGQGSNESLAFACAHLSDGAAVQGDPTDHLNVKMAQTNRPFGGFADHGKGFGQDLFERLLPGLELILLIKTFDIPPPSISPYFHGKWGVCRGG